MATVRRLSDDDVKAVFECIYSNKLPSTKALRFHIVPVGPEGLRLSPPSYQFQDGLYVLLKPEKKAHRDTVVRKKVPSNLQGLVVSENAFSVDCPWSLSGPQFPQPTGIQQRYCYPKGDPSYSGNKGGALWTMVCFPVYFGIFGKQELQICISLLEVSFGVLVTMFHRYMFDLNCISCYL